MTEKQLRWQKRNRILWRLKGMAGFPFEEGVLTPLENDCKEHKEYMEERNAKDNFMPRYSR